MHKAIDGKASSNDVEDLAFQLRNYTKKDEFRDLCERFEFKVGVEDFKKLQQSFKELTEITANAKNDLLSNSELISKVDKKIREQDFLISEN